MIMGRKGGYNICLVAIMFGLDRSFTSTRATEPLHFVGQTLGAHAIINRDS